MYKCDLKRMSEKIHTFAKFGATEGGGVTRYALSDEDVLARDYFVERMKAIGAVIETDDLANMYATIPGSDPSAKRIVMGSHCDSVRQGGNYDGILGVIGAMEVLETIVAEKIPHKHPLTAMIWTNEEGSLYPPALFGSGIICNDYLPEAIAKNFKYEDKMKSLSILDKTTTFGSKLENFKYKGDKKNRINPDQYKCMFEMHIEQGPILEDAGNELGVVDCVLGMFNYRISFFGQAAHAGTFPMKKRKDALYASALALCWLHEEIDKLGDDELVYTTGEQIVSPGVHTVIPDFVEFSIDVRHEKPEVLKQVLDIVKALPEKEWAGCKCQIKEAWKRDTVYWDKKMIGYVEESVKKLGFKHQYIHSGAGHDAQFASYMVPTTMIFVVSKDGLSHNENEYTSDESCTNTATVMLNAVLKADAAD